MSLLLLHLASILPAKPETNHHTTAMPAPKNETLQAQTQLVRNIEAALKVDVPDAMDLKFRGSLLRKATAEISELSSGFITRLHEAACDVKFPSEEVTEFRHALQRAIAKSLGLEAYKAKPTTAAKP